MTTICIFGDSNAWGAWDMEKGGWVNRLWLFLAEKDTSSRLYNLSTSGGTTGTVLLHFETEAKIRRADVLIFQKGGNDAAYEHSEGNYLVSPEQFKTNIQEIIWRARRITDKIIFVGFHSVDETKTKPVPWGNTYYTNENIKKYSEIMKDVCLQNKVPFLEVFDLLENSDLKDGVHANAAGHRKIFERIKKFLLDNQIVKT